MLSGLFQRDSRISLRLFVILGILCLLFPLSQKIYSSYHRSEPTAPVIAAWARAQERGSYRFSADILQWRVPTATLANVGRSSREERAYLEGWSDLRRQAMNLKVWSRGGSLLQAESGVEVQISEGKTQVRRSGGPWEEASDFTGAFAPQGDFLAYLSAIRNVGAGSVEERAGLRFTRYSFTIDGPAFAAYVRDQLQRSYQQQGKLPPGVALSTSDHYAQMTGAGELWVGEDGLPLRQIIDLRFPPQNDEVVSARITVNFSEYGQPLSGLAQITGSAALTELLARWLGYAGLFFLLAGLGVWLVVYRRARTLQRAVAIGMCLLIVVQPLLSNVPTLRFLDEQQAQAAAAEVAQAESEMQQAVRAFAAEKTFDPLADPLAHSALAPHNSQPATRNSQFDSDSDGLTDFQESIIGTNPHLADSDGDGVSDGLEVIGFVRNGVTWRTDPLAIDSNGDGLSDGQEWQTDLNRDGLPDDTDGDGVPDIFDDDNDGDGVPDWEDISPLTVLRGRNGASAFSAAQPFSYTLQGLQPGMLTLVDIQLRPTDPDRLWYAYNALDWPHDTDGQLQDWDAGPEGADDLKLLPMLEIRIPATANTNLPSQEQLTPFNIFITEMTHDGTAATPVIGKTLYVPLNVVVDRQSDARVAFSAHIPYLPDGVWTAAHEVRMIWAAQMLLDGCQRSQWGSCQEFTVHNQPTIIQTYDDEWILTGFSVREDRGVATAVVYEDPAVDDDLHDDPVLWPLSAGLERTFLAGRDADSNGQRDLTVAEITRRFDRDDNSGVSLDQRWNLSNTLQVESQRYATLDLAAATTTMTTTKNVLGRVFSPHWASAAPITPTLLYVREESYRGLGLDELGKATPYASFSNGRLALHLAPSGQPAVETDVLAWMQWTPYCASPGTGGAAVWQDCPLDRYWDELTRRYGALVAEPGDSEAMALGRLTLGQIYYLAMASGAGEVVQTGAQVLFDPEVVWSDLEARVTLSIISAGRAVLASVARYIILIWFVDPVAVLASIGIAVNDVARSSANKIIFNPQVSKAVSKFHQSSSAAGKMAVVGKVALVVAAIAVGLLAKAIWPGNIGARIVSNVVALGLTLYMSVIQPLMLAVKWASLLVRQGLATTLGSAYLRVLRGNAALGGSAKMAGAIGAVVGVVVAWGFFIDGWVKSGAVAGSPAINRAFFQTVAVTIYLIALAVLSATVIGGLLVALLTLIDVIASFICIGSGVDEADCFSISALVIQGIASTLYAYELMIDTSRSDFVQTGAPDVRLANQLRGFVEGNPLTLSLPITTTAAQQSPRNVLATAYMWMYTEDSLRETSVRYALSRSHPRADLVATEPGAMRNEWRDVKQVDTGFFNKALYGGYATTTNSLDNVPLTAGIDRPLEFILNTGYALPSMECWTLWIVFIPIPVCSQRSESGTSAVNVTDVKFDILPATVDGFMALADAPGGSQLAWDARFPRLADADNDGVPAAVDPNDQRWDSDGDGLADSFELNRRQDGAGFDPTHWDRDGDGLSDAQEVRFGTDPANPDTDGDGLRDGDEVYHPVYALVDGVVQPTGEWRGGWPVVIDGLTVWATSDPLVADSDGDGLSDRLERDLALSSNPALRVDGDGRPYHPRTANGNPLAVQVRSNAAKGYVRPGQPLFYTTTLGSHTGDPLFEDASITVSGGGSVVPAFGGTRYLSFYGQPQATTTFSVTVAHNASGQTALTSSGFARLAPAITGWEWLSASGGEIPVAGSHKNLPALAADPLMPDRYHLSFLSRRTGGNDAENSHWRYLLSDSAADAFGSLNGQYTRTDDPPNVACLPGGECLFIRSQQPGSNPSSVLGAIQQGGFFGGSGVTIPRPDGAHDYAPVVASNGTEFLVLWERLTFNPEPAGDGFLIRVISTLLAQRVDALGNRLGAPATWLTAEIAALTRPVNTLTVAEMDDIRRNSGVDMEALGVEGGYSLFWKRRGDVELWARAGGSDGNPTGGALLLANDLTPDGWRPAVAYDPVRKRFLRLDYSDLGDAIGLNAYLMDGLETGQKLNTFLPISPRTRVAWDALTGGWAIAAATFGDTLDLLALDADGAPLVADAPEQSLTFSRAVDAAPAPSLTCSAPGWADKLLLDLPFDELPGATLLRDRSGNDHHIDCTANHCPLVGTTAGAPSPLYSAYGLTFDGMDDSLAISRVVDSDFTIALWLRSTQTAGTDGHWWQGMGLVDGEVFEVRNDFGLSLGAGKVLFGTGWEGVHDRTIRSGFVADGNWHFVVATRQRLSGRIALYINGQLVESDPSASSQFLNAPPHLRIGSLQPGVNFYAGALDNVQIYGVELNASQILALYQRGRLPNDCLIAAPAGESVVYHRFGVTPVETGGSLTPSASDTLTLTVDAAPPASRITSLADGAYVKGSPGAPQTLIIAGEAADAASGVTAVEVGVNGGAFVPAEGAATWVHALSLPGEGVYTLRSRARDLVGNVETPGGGILLVVDATPPQMSIDPPDRPLRPRRNAAGRWVIRLSGEVSDPAIGARPGSGVAAESVEVLITRRNAREAAGDRWQRATLDGNRWTIDYLLPKGIGKATGVYDINLRAEDLTGNRIEPALAASARGNAASTTVDLQLDSDGPGVLLAPGLSAQTLLTRTGALRGVISDTTGVGSVQAAFVPIAQIAVLSGTVALLTLDEGAGAVWYGDRTHQQNNAICDAPSCPVAGEAGRIDGAVRFDGGSPLRVADSPSLNFDGTSDFTLHAWLKTTDASGAILSKREGGNGYALRLQNGRLVLEVNGQVVMSGPPELNDNGWHQVAATVDRSQGMARLYTDNLLRAEAAFGGPAASAGDLLLGEGFNGALDQVMVIRRSLVAEEVSTLFQAAELTRHPVALAQSGAGVINTTWALSVPHFLEGFHQLDLYTTDTLGNRRLAEGVWRGIADTEFPRVSLTVTPTGDFYADPATNVIYYEIGYHISAEDLHLSDNSFVTPCDGIGQKERSYLDTHWLRTLFPDLTARYRLEVSCNRWDTSHDPFVQIFACDLYGNCGEAVNLPSGKPLPSDDGFPRALSVIPQDGSVVAGGGSARGIGAPIVYPATVAASSAQSLREVTVLVNGAEVQTLSFSQEENVRRLARSLPLTLPGEGSHTLAVRAVDWAGNVQQTLKSVEFTLDGQPPSLTLETSALGVEDTYAPGSGVMRFRGTASDTVGLAAVQLRVGNGRFEDATLHPDGTWSTAYWIGSHIYTGNLPVVVRAIDRAGRITEISRGVALDIPVPPGVIPQPLAPLNLYLPLVNRSALVPSESSTRTDLYLPAVGR